MNYLSDYSVWWIIPIIIAAAFASYFYYFNSSAKTSWNRRQRKILFLLRFTSLTLLLVLLLGLVWETIEYRKEKPLFITLVDASTSMMNYKDSTDVKKNIEAYRNVLKSKFNDRFELIEWGIGNQNRVLHKLNFADPQTDIGSAFSEIRNHFFNRNIGGIVLISDGNFNKGMHPMYEAERIELTPVFTLGVGDTTLYKDILLRSVNTNDVAYLKNSFPIEANVDFQKVPKGEYRIDLLLNGNLIETKFVNTTNSFYDQKSTTFNVTAKQVGFQRYTVRVSGLEFEKNTKNNSRTCYIEVVDNKNYILCLSSAPHPDIAAIRSVLEEDQKSQVESVLSTNFSLKNKFPNLVVWYENGVKPNINLFNSLREKKIPIFFILGPNTPSGVLQSYQMGLKIPAGAQQEDCYPVVSKGFASFDFNTTTIDLMNQFPPLRVKFGNYTLPPNAQVLLNQRVGSIVKTDALFYFSEQQNRKTAVLLGEGIWRWKMKEFVATKSIAAFREFIQKTTQFLTVGQQTDALRISLPKRFTNSENIEVKAEFYNEAMELITTPVIKFSYKRKNGAEFKSVFTAVNNFYKTDLGRLKSGAYTWSATAEHKGKTYTKTGVFVVEEIALEDLDSRSNFNVLNQLAKQSEGKFYNLSEYPELMDELENRDDITTLQFADARFNSLIEQSVVFILLILLLGTEWFLRRFWGV